MNDVDFGLGASGKLRAVLLVSLAVFMSSLGVGILDAPMNMKPILGYLLKAFIGLVFGGIAAICLLIAFRSLRQNPGLPPELLARCLTCGERSPHDLVCPVCSEPPQDRRAALKVQNEEWLGQLFGAVILSGVGCLGIFIMIGPYLDGERRWWALIAFFALGLLMFLVGAGGFLGLLLTIRNYIREANTFSFSGVSLERWMQGQGKIAWGQVVGMQGKGIVKAPLTSKGRSEGGYRASPGDIALAEALATFDAGAFIELHENTTYDWRLGDISGKTRSADEPFQRKVERRVMIAHCPDISYGADLDAFDADEIEAHVEPRPENGQDAAIRRYLKRHLAKEMPLRDYKTHIDADPVYREQLQTYGRLLRDQGVVTSNALVEAVIEALVRSEQTARAND